MFAKNPTPKLLCASLALLASVGCSKTETNRADVATKHSQSLTINNASEPETLDPQLASGVQEANVIRQFSEGLITTDNDGNTVGGMAESWQSDDNQTWIFQLRDAKWSNGDPVTAHDFVYSFRRLVDPATASYYASYLEDAKIKNAAAIIQGKTPPADLGVVALDDKTLKIELSEPVPYFVDMLIHTSVQPVHPASVQKFGNKWSDPANIVVNGPYKPVSWIVNEKIVLQRNPHYYNNAQSKLDELVILPIASATTDVQRYQAGDVDITASEIPPEQFASLKQTLGDEVKTAPTLCTYYYDFNHKKPPFDDERVRRALSLAFDRETVTQKVMGQGQIPAYQFTPTAIKGGVRYNPPWQNTALADRVAEAKRLLNEAGYSASNPLRFEILYDTNEMHKKIAVAVASLYKTHLDFVDITLNNQEWKSYLDSRRVGSFQMARARWCGDYNEASTFLNLMKSDNTNNWSGFNSPEYDAIMAQTLGAKNDDERARLYEKAEQILDEKRAHINVFYYANVRLVKPYVIGYSNKDPLDQWHAKYWSVAAP